MPIRDVAQLLNQMISERRDLSQKIIELEEAGQRLDATIEEIQKRTRETPVVRDGLYKGMTTVEAVKALLRSKGRPMKTTELRDAILAGGFETKAKDFYSNLYATLAKKAQKPERSGISKSDKGWALTERSSKETEAM